MHGFSGNNPSAPPLGVNSGENPYLLAKRLMLERQRSLPGPYSSPARQNILSSTADNALSQNHTQNVDLMSARQGLAERASSNVNNGMGGWLNFPVQGGQNPHQDKLDIHHAQNFPPQSAIGMQQRLQLQNPSLSNLLPKSMDNQSNLLTPDNLLTSDPQLLSLLQQQYMLQLQSQVPVTPQQPSYLDKIMLIQQQKKQEEQQQLLRQQQLISQLLSEQHPNQRLGDPSFQHMQGGGLAAGNTNVDHAPFQQPHELYKLGLQMQSSNPLASPSIPLDFSQSIAPETSIHAPHLTFANNVEQRNWNASLPHQIVQKQQDMSSLTTDRMEEIQKSEVMKNSLLEDTSYDDETARAATADVNLIPVEKLAESVKQDLTAADNHKDLNALEESSVRTFEYSQDLGEQGTGESSPVKEMKTAEVVEAKKPTEKKSKKQKALKVSTDLVKGASKPQQPRLDSDKATLTHAKPETLISRADALEASISKKERSKYEKVTAEDVDFPANQLLSARSSADDGATVENKGQTGQAELASDQTHAGQRAWKAAPGFKPKSLLEIQQEEQRRRAQEEVAVSEISTSIASVATSTPWGGVNLSSDYKSPNVTLVDAGPELKTESSSILKSKKSQAEDLFWDDTTRSADRETEVSQSATWGVSSKLASSQSNAVADDDFIEAKDTKKSRKKSSKVKNAGAKVAPAAPVDAPVASSPNDKGKIARQLQQEKEAFMAVPSGPSLGDFVLWKDESACPSPAPAWSTDSGKPNKPTSLRDILKEQQRSTPPTPSVPVPIPQKSTTNQTARGSGNTWSVSGSSPAKAASPRQVSSISKNKLEDDLFWGPVEQVKPDAKQYVSPFIHYNLCI